MSDLYFVDCCSPTLASIKCGSLFNCCFEDRNDFINWTQNYCKQFCRFGLRLLVLRVNDHNALIYLFRISVILPALSFCGLSVIRKTAARFIPVCST